ncbi:obscurin-like protein 1 [Salvelinus namaycush]|uniref:Obscurin-like protein 1 n=1 Tax=Salvelinus namaycush TaxID=8040 RepID=A0A8U0UHY4_SALNM|nr:obscurin-like protein 1 [Salvelinus namaycush]
MDIFGGAPRVLGYSRPVAAQCGTDTVLQCKIGGDPRPEVVWEKKNVQILSEGHYRLSEEGQAYFLHITGVRLEDAGQYICKASNTVGETCAPATLKVEGNSQEREGVQKQTEVDQQSGEVDQQSGEVDQQSGKVEKEKGEGSEREKKKQRYEGEPLLSDDRPHFLIKPLSLRLDRGEDAAFSCKLSGNPLPQVVWEKDGKKLSDIFESAHFNVSSQDGGWFQLKIFRTRMPDGGVYTCRAHNNQGGALAGAVLLVELVPERQESGASTSNGYSNGQTSPRSMRHRMGRHGLSRQPDEPNLNSANVKKFTVSEGKHAKFRCFVTGKPKPEIIWKKDGAPLEAGRRHLLFEDREGYYTLKVMYCKHQDTGLYVCAASNALGHTLSSVYLTVKAPAVRFRRSLQDVEVKERGMAVLECEVPNEGIPTAWYLEDQRLQPGGKYGIEQKGTRRRLTIRDVGADDDGVYLCEMPDGGKSIAELAVKGTIVKKLPRKLDVLEGENAVFCVEVEEENMDVHWFKDGLKLRESHQTILKSFGKTHILVFVNVCHGDTGVVTFVVGRSKTTSRLRVKAARHSPPICPVGVEMDVDRPNSVLLSWEPAPTSQTTTRSVYVLERQEVGSQEWLRCATSDMATSAEVMGDSVPCEGDYRFRVCCINKYGRSGHVEFPKVVHLVPGPKIRTPLRGCEVTEGEDALFSIDLSVMVTGTWFLNSTQLQDTQHYSIQQAKTQHSLVIHSTKVEDHEAEVTFIANGVRDSAVLKVQAAVVKFSPMSESDSNKRVETGNPVVLYCEVSHPSARVGWFKDGVELQVTDGLNIQSEDNMRRIVIQSAEFTDSGVYTCETMGDVIKFNVEVEGPPVQFSEVPEEELQKSAMELDPVVLTCEVSREDANATWYKDGIEVQASDNITIQTEGTLRRLIIRCAETSDAGTYSCQSGDNSLSFIVNIKEPPVMIVEPKEDVVMEGHISEQVVLQCELSRSSGEVHWFKDGLQVLEMENVQLTSEGPYRRLTVLCGSAEDSGEYVCDTDGDSVFFQVTITELPVRIVSPTESELELTSPTSERLELSCEISQPDAQVRWYRDGLEVEESASLILEVQGAHRTLVIPTTTVEDTGEYVCDTEDDSVTWLVTITEPPVKLARSETMSDVMDCFSGDPIVLEIEVSRFNAEVIWMKDGGEVEESSDVTITEDGLIRRLTIRTPAPGDSGKYTCLASDDLIDFQVKVSEPPVKIVNRSEVKTEVKSLPSNDIELECELSRANAVAKWYKDGRRLNEDERFCEEEEGAFRSLVILNAELEDCGDYFLDAGDDNITFHVTVQEPPVTILGNSEDADYQEMVAGDDLILACEVSRANAPVQWYCNDRQLTSDDRTYIESYGTLRKLILSDILPSDSGKYMCDAIDDKMVTMVKIQVPRVVEFLTELHNTMVLEGEDATFKCVVSPEDVQLVWGMDGELVVMGARFQATQNGLCHTMVIKSCQVLDSSKITVEAEGNVSKATLKVQEAQVTFTKKMEAVMAEEYGDATMETEVSLDTGEVQWMRQGVVIQPGPRHTLGQSGRKRSLTICNLNLSDRGTYRCETLHDRTQVKLNVEPRKIAIRKGLAETDTFERETASFEVELSHTGVEGVWQKDGIRVKPSNHWRVSCNGLVHGLTLSNLTLEDTGTIVFSAEGVRTSARLTVKETPVTIMKKLIDMRLEQGSPATLECELSRQNVEVKWLKNGTELKPGKTQYRIYSMGRKRFCQLLQCSLSDAGTYTCDVGDVNTSCNLEVYEPELEVLHGLEDLYVQEDQNAVFMCEVSMEDVTGEWYKDGHKIRPTSTIKIRTEGTKHFLLMCSVKAEDSGEIRFVTKQTESTAYLEVEEAPVSIVKPLRDRTALEKHRVILDCTVSTPRCELTWYRGKAELVSSDRLEIHSDGCYHKLTIHEATVEDEGTYSIEVGEHTSTAQLLVEAQSLVIETELEDVAVTAPDQACFQCEVSVAISRPPVWTLNGETIQSSPDVRLENHGTVHKLNLKQTRPDMSGTVTFAMGKAKSSAKLNVMWK